MQLIGQVLALCEALRCILSARKRKQKRYGAGEWKITQEILVL